MSKHTPGPWDYVASTEHHGPYITTVFGTTIADLYTMTEPGLASTAAGGPSKPISFMAEMAEHNARLIAAAPDMLEALNAIATVHISEIHDWQSVAERMQSQALAAIAKATGEAS